MQSRCSWDLASSCIDVVGVVGGQQRDLQVLGQPQQAVADPVLDVEAVVHQLEEVVLPAEDVLEVGGGLAGGVVVAVAQVHLHLARGAAGGADDAAAVLGEQLAVHPRVLEEAVAPGAGGEPEQVVHALGGLREQRHVGVGAAVGDVVGAAAVEVDALALEAGDVGREVGLDADDRLDPGRLGLRVELVGAEHVAVVGHRDRRHPQLGGPLRSGHRAGPPRRAWSTRCGRAGGRRSPGRRSPSSRVLPRSCVRCRWAELSGCRGAASNSDRVHGVDPGGRTSAYATVESDRGRAHRQPRPPSQQARSAVLRAGPGHPEVRLRAPRCPQPSVRSSSTRPRAA